MEICFRTNKLERILTNERLIKKHYQNCHQGLISRLTELDSVSNLSLISYKPPPRRHKLQGSSNQWAVDVSKNYRLIFSSYDPSIVEETLITKIIVEKVEDYH